jgi:predicted small metal-binding protein
MKTVFILGARASVEAGAPLMRDFVQKAKLLQSQRAYGIHATEIQDVLDAAFKNLRSVHAKSSIEYDNIEELFSAIDIGQLIQTFGSRAQQTID